MDVGAGVLLFVAGSGAWILLPFIPAVRELRARRDALPVQVVRDSEVDIHYFVRGFRGFLRDRLADALALCGQKREPVEGRLEDGTEYLAIPEGAADAPSRLVRGTTCDSVIASRGDLHLAGDITYLKELYAAGSMSCAEGSVCRAILAERDARLAPRSASLRWLHAGGSVRAGEGTALLGRASADAEIHLARGCRFERLNAPRIVFGEPLVLPSPVQDQRLLSPDDLHGVVDVAAGRWLVRGDLEVPENSRIEADLVVTGKARLGDRTRIVGGVKGHRLVALGRGVRVEGSVISEREVRVGEGCRIRGPVVSEGSIAIERGSVIGSSDSPTSVTGRRIDVAEGVTAHGTVWAHREGRVTGPEREGGES